MDAGTILLPNSDMLEDFVSGWEQVALLGLADDPENFLPGPDHPLYLSALAEILRKKIRFDRAKGISTDSRALESRFPLLFQSRIYADQIREACLASSSVRASGPLKSGTPQDDIATRHDIGIVGRPRPADWPALETNFHGYLIVAVLGEGSFGRVFLAEQLDLSDRRVVLKLSRRLTKIEPRLMARLQHTHIVPIYGTFQVDGFEVICMPWYGATTFNDVLHRLIGRSAMPLSGGELVDTLTNARYSTRAKSASSSRTGRERSTPRAEQFHGPASLAPPTEEPAFPSGEILKPLEDFSRSDYVDAILSMGACLADALAHAHLRGIVHRDIKPANILLTDDGCPMLLDFNLSDDLDAAPGSARTGGTPAYMPPEQLAVIRDCGGRVDHRIDIYALGLVLFELIAGKPPFPRRIGATADIIPQMIADRLAGAPSLAALNPQATPATQSIVEKCLAPDPANRYATADRLAEDLRRQVRNLPLRHAPNRSTRERFRKWVRRNPVATSTGSIGLLTIVVAGSLGAVAMGRQTRLEHLELLQDRSRARQNAVDSLERLTAQSRQVQFVLTRRVEESGRIREAELLADDILTRYGIADRSWQTNPLVLGLDESERKGLMGTLEDVLFVRTHSAIRFAANDASRIGVAILWHRLLLELDPANSTSPTWLQQNADLSELAGAGAVPPRADTPRSGDDLSARDLFMLGRLRMVEGKPALAIPLLKSATHREPRAFWAWFLLANAFDEIGDYAAEDAAFQLCAVLWPESVETHFQRGLCRLYRRDYSGARENFVRATELDADYAAAWLNRAICESKVDRAEKGLASVARALALGRKNNTAYLLRSRLRTQTGDEKGAREDEVLAMSLAPQDERDWADRGAALRIADPKRALQCLEESLRINPYYFRALQDRIWLMDDRFGDIDGAVRASDRTLELYPSSLSVRAARGLYLARRSPADRPAALEDARHCLSVSNEPTLLYRIAGIYARTSAQHPEDAPIALKLLVRAFRAGYGLDIQDRDTDLDGLRKSKDFQESLRAAKTLDAMSKVE